VGGDETEESLDALEALELLERQVGVECVVQRLVAGFA
jgi:hypothetical protein